MNSPSRMSSPWLLLVVAGLLLAAVGCNNRTLFPVANQHDAGWKAAHGRYVIQAGGPTQAKVANGMTCNLCHEVETATASSKGSSVSCYNCHATGPTGNPHADGWRSAHGAFVQAAGDHTKAALKEGTGTGKTCAQCHTAAVGTNGAIPESPAAESTCYSCHYGPNP